MAPANTLTGPQPVHGTAVPPPRAYDAIGGALRGAYRNERSMPRDLADALMRLDRTD